MPGTHALLGASSSHRWMSCPPSARLEEQFPEEQSEFAAEGTFAHSLAEFKLRKHFTKMKKSEFEKGYAELKKSEFYSAGLEEYIDEYIGIVAEHYGELKKLCKDPIILFEQRLDFSAYVPEGFGTGDVVIIADGLMDIIDLKYGKGVTVSAVETPQIRLYGLGALNEFECLYDIDCVRLTIVQIRLANVSTEEIGVDCLKLWGENAVKPRAQEAFEGKGKFDAGEHCQFCRARFTCRARAEKNLEIAKYDFQEPALLSNEEIADILARADELSKWAGDISGYAQKEAVENGVKWPGWKLVEGRSTRKYKDELEVAKVLEAGGFPEASIFERSLYGITAMEKLVGKKKFSELLADLIEKPAGKPTLVPESDKRAEINSLDSAKEDFKEA